MLCVWSCFHYKTEQYCSIKVDIIRKRDGVKMSGSERNKLKLHSRRNDGHVKSGECMLSQGSESEFFPLAI